MATKPDATQPTVAQLLAARTAELRNDTNRDTKMLDLLVEVYEKEAELTAKYSAEKLGAWKAMLADDVALTEQRGKVLDGLTRGTYKDHTDALQRDLANLREQSAKVAMNYSAQGDMLLQRITERANQSTTSAAERSVKAWQDFATSAPTLSPTLPFMFDAMVERYGAPADALARDPEVLRSVQMIEGRAKHFKEQRLRVADAINDPEQLGLLAAGAAGGDTAKQAELRGVLDLLGDPAKGLDKDFVPIVTDKDMGEGGGRDLGLLKLEKAEKALDKAMGLHHAGDGGVGLPASASSPDASGAAAPPANWFLGQTGLSHDDLAQMMAKPAFQEWASDHGFVVGSGSQNEDGTWSYSPGKDDIRALRYAKAQAEGKRTPHRRGFSPKDVVTLPLSDDDAHLEDLRHPGGEYRSLTFADGSSAMLHPEEAAHLDVPESEPAKTLDIPDEEVRVEQKPTRYGMNRDGMVLAITPDGDVWRIDPTAHTKTKLDALPPGVDEAKLVPWWDGDTGQHASLDQVVEATDETNITDTAPEKVTAPPAPAATPATDAPTPASPTVTVHTETPSGKGMKVVGLRVPRNPRDPVDTRRVQVGGVVRLFQQDGDHWTEIPRLRDGRFDYPGSIVEPHRGPWRENGGAIERRPTSTKEANPASTSTSTSTSEKPTLKERIEARTATPPVPLGGAKGPAGNPVVTAKANTAAPEAPTRVTPSVPVKAPAGGSSQPAKTPGSVWDGIMAEPTRTAPTQKPDLTMPPALPAARPLEKGPEVAMPKKGAPPAPNPEVAMSTPTVPDAGGGVSALGTMKVAMPGGPKMTGPAPTESALTAPGIRTASAMTPTPPDMRDRNLREAKNNLARDLDRGMPEKPPPAPSPFSAATLAKVDQANAKPGVTGATPRLDLDALKATVNARKVGLDTKPGALSTDMQEMLAHAGQSPASLPAGVTTATAGLKAPTSTSTSIGLADRPGGRTTPYARKVIAGRLRERLQPQPAAVDDDATK